MTDRIPIARGTTPRRALLAAATLLLAACSSPGAIPSSAGPTPQATSLASATPGPTPALATPSVSATPATPAPVASAPAATPAPTAEPTVAATPTLGPTATAGEVDLGALVPSEIGGFAVSVSEGDGEAFLDIFQRPKVAQDLLDALGKKPSDASIATGFLYNDTGGLYIYAYRVAGADSKQLFDGIVQGFTDLFPGIKVGPATVAGKATMKMEGRDPGSVPMYYYSYQDMVFAATSTSTAWVEEVFAKLP